MNIKLLAFDMDGTILNDEKRISQKTMEALRRTHERGILLVPASGRTLPGLPKELKGLYRYAITINGGKVIDTQTGEALYRAEIELPLAVELVDYFRSIDTLCDCYQNDWGWMEPEAYRNLDRCITNPNMCAYARSVRTQVPDLREYLLKNGIPVQKMQAYFRSMELRMEQEKLLAERYPELAISSSLGCNIELNARDANKGAALAALCEKLGIPIEQAAAFGDGSNDLTMIQRAGLGVAMANSHPKVLAAARVVTGDNNRDGAADAIYRYIL